MREDKRAAQRDAPPEQPPFEITRRPKHFRKVLVSPEDWEPVREGKAAEKLVAPQTLQTVRGRTAPR